MKVLTTPVIVCIQYFLYKITLPWSQISALVPICFGVILATVTSLDANYWGTFWGLSAGNFSIIISKFVAGPVLHSHYFAGYSRMYLCISNLGKNRNGKFEM